MIKRKPSKAVTKSKKLSTNGYEFLFIRSDRKTASIEIKNDLGAVLRAPISTTDAQAIQIIQKNNSWIKTATEKMLEKQTKIKEPSPDEVLRLKKLAKTVIPEKVKVYASIMNVLPVAITITSARTRFGSCSGKNRLSFSYLLMQYPERAIDYVVVHELAHIRHKNHSKAFYNEISKYMPDYKERKKLLK